MEWMASAVAVVQHILMVACQLHMACLPPPHHLFFSWFGCMTQWERGVSWQMYRDCHSEQSAKLVLSTSLHNEGCIYQVSLYYPCCTVLLQQQRRHQHHCIFLGVVCYSPSWRWYILRRNFFYVCVCACATNHLLSYTTWAPRPRSCWMSGSDCTT